MATWVAYGVTAAAETLPPSLATAYGSWLESAGAREARLAAITDGVVADFRSAVLADYDAAGVLSTSTLPSYCLRHAASMVWYYLALECGYDVTELRSGWQDAEVYLRSLYVAQRAGGTFSGVVGTPRYSGSPASLLRRASGLGGGPVTGLPVTTGTMSEAELALRARLDNLAASAAALAALSDAYEIEDLKTMVNALARKLAGV